MNTKIFIIGDSRGAYRNEYLMRILKDTKSYEITGTYEAEKGNHSSRLFKSVTLFKNLIRSDLVFVCSCKHNSSVAKTAFLLKKKIITDFYLSFYDTDVLDRHKVSSDSNDALKLLKIDQDALLRSSILLFLNKAEANYYTKLLNVNLEDLNYKIVPLCIPDKRKADLPYFHGRTETIRFCWCGTYIPLQGLDKIIEASKIAIEKGLNMKLTIWGDDAKKAQPYVKKVGELGIADYVDFINKWDSLESWQSYIISNCDVSMGIFGDSEKAKTVLANKVVDGVAFGTPVITAESKGVSEFFSDGLFICKNDPNSIAEKMIEVSQLKKEEIMVSIKKAFNVYEQNFAPVLFQRKIIECIEELKNAK